MNHQIILPPAILKKYVRFFWTLDQSSVANNESVLKIFACRFPRMVFQHDNGHSAIKKEDDLLPNAFFSGINIKPYTTSMSGSFTLTGVSFYPDAIKPLFGIDTYELCDEFPDLLNFIDRAFCEKIIEADNQESRIKMLIDLLCKRLNRKDFKANELESTMISQPDFKHHDASVLHLRKWLNISERQLERKFKSMVGLTPKQYLRISRFEHAYALIQQNEDNKLGSIAYELNYVDQSHFIKDFKELSSLTPKELAKKETILEESSSIVFNAEE